MEIFILIYYALIVSIIEVYYWEQEIKKEINFIPKIRILGTTFNVYWLIHPLLLLLPIYLITHNIVHSIGYILLYGILEDILYFRIARLLGSSTRYSTQDWMSSVKTGKYRIPIFYFIFIVIGIILITML